MKEYIKLKFIRHEKYHIQDIQKIFTTVFTHSYVMLEQILRENWHLLDYSKIKNFSTRNLRITMHKENSRD